MPPPTRFWVILIGKVPTSFHAKEREDLVPTLRQLQRTQKEVTLRWFERGKMWESPDAAEGAAKLAATEAREKRTKDWRPGGDHRDPRARFEMTRDQKRAKFKRDQRGGEGGASDRGGNDDGAESPFGPRVPRPVRDRSDRPAFGRPAFDRPRPDRPRPDRPDRPDRPERPTGERSPFGGRRPGAAPADERRRERPFVPPMENPFGDRPRPERRPDSDRPARPTGRPPGRPPAGRGGGFKPPKRRS